MSDIAKTSANIAAVERETGLGKDTLRVWERRYGFPKPERDSNGDRQYPADQIARLRLIKRLMDRGYRPGKLVTAPDSELLAMVSESASSPGLPAASADPAADFSDSKSPPGDLQEVLDCLARHDAIGLRRVMAQLMVRQGLHVFVHDIVPRLNKMVGDGWDSGRIEIFAEHLYTEQMQLILRQAIGSLPPGTRRPKILLTTVPEEQHALGILMLESLLTLQGLRCVSLGTQTPLSEIVAAVAAHGADVVALSFSAAFPARQVMPLVLQLRRALPASTCLWIGGDGLDKGLEKRLIRELGSLTTRGTNEPSSLVVCRSLGDALGQAELTAQAMA